MKYKSKYKNGLDYWIRSFTNYLERYQYEMKSCEIKGMKLKIKKLIIINNSVK